MYATFTVAQGGESIRAQGAHRSRGGERKLASSTPTPDKRVRGSQTGRPIMALLDLLGRRWSLRILYELREESLSFRALRSRCDDVSPSVLNSRLAELRESGFVELRDGGGYTVTRFGQELCRVLVDLNGFAARWARRQA
jgi:DNA-binding HxlR family transcriptional regulator